MNLINRSIFKSMRDAITSHMEAVKVIIDEYVQETDKERAIAKKFKDEDQYFQEKQQIAIEKARSALNREFMSLRASLKIDASNMRKSLQAYLAEPLQENFVQKLTVYSTFCIPMTRTEIDSLLTLNQGNPTGLRALKHVMESTNTPWKLNFHDIGSLEDDVYNVERIAAHATYTPLEMSIPALEILKGTNIIDVRDDNTPYESGRTHDNITLMIERQIVSGFLESLEEMEKAWIADVSTPSISRASMEEAKYLNDVDDELRKQGIPEQYLDRINEPESTVSVESDPATKLIREMQQNNDSRTYNEAIGHYIK